MMENMGYGQQERLKDIVEKEAEEEEQPTATKEEEDNTDLTTHENEEDGHTRVEMAFNSLMTEFSEDSDINDLIKRMLPHIKIQVENSRMPESGFSLDKIMHLSKQFVLCQVSRSLINMSYESVPRWTGEIPEHFKKQEMCNETIAQFSYALRYVPDHLKT